MRRIPSLFLLCLAPSVLVAGCDPGTDVGPPASLRIDPASDTLHSVVDSVRFDAAVLDADGDAVTGAVVQWRGPDPGYDMLTVRQNGWVIGGAGHPSPVPIIASSGAVEDTAWLYTVYVPAQVTLDSATLELESGASRRLRALVLDSALYAIDAGVTWRSTDPSVVAVAEVEAHAGGESHAVVSAVAEGSAWVVAEAGDAADSAAVTVVPPEPVRFASVDAGYVGHACALSEEGRAYCWGFGHWGQLGTGDTGGRSDPTPVATDLRFVEIIAGNRHSCGRTEAGALWCWGEASFIGGGENDTCAGLPCATTPVQVTGIPAIAALRGTRVTCALTAGGDAWCLESEPRRPFEDLDVVDAVTTEWESCVLTGAGEVWCRSRVAGEPTFLEASNSSFTSITGGYGQRCALTGDGEAWCWGANSAGQLGIGTAGRSEEDPLQVVGGLAFRSLHAGGWVEDFDNRSMALSITCGVAVDGTGYCWGANDHGQLGSGELRSCASENEWDPITLTCEPAPVPVADVPSFASISPGGTFACGIGDDGVLYCWGSNRFGALGIGGEGLAPVQCGEGYTCAHTPMKVHGQPDA